MRRFLSLSLIFFFVLSMFSCSKAEVNRNKKGNVAIPNRITSANILIVYFSRAGENYAVGHISVGNTAIMAGFIQNYTGGTLFEIVPKVPYPDSYEEMKALSIKESNSNARPAIKNPLENLDKYSIIFVGSPIWYDGTPMIMRTFYETYRDKLAGKILVPFGTHEGSGVSACTDLAKEYFPQAKLLETLGIRGNNVKSSRTDVEMWLQRIGIPKKEQK